MQQDETSEIIYLTNQCLNPSQLDGNSSDCSINIKTNDIVKDLSQYNVYFNSITLTTSELPYCNLYRNLIDVTNNVLNFSITLYDASNTNTFKVPDYGTSGNYNALPVGTIDGSGNSAGVCVFLVYVSENLPNNKEQRAYYNLHSINQFMGFINNAISQAISYWNNPPADMSLYFRYEPILQFYQFVCTDNFKTSTIDLYTNTFLERLLDGFRWVYYGVSEVIPVPINTPPIVYTGMDNKFVKFNYPDNKTASDTWYYTTEYNCIANLLDVHSILIISDSGSLNALRKQFIPTQNTFNGVNDKDLNLPTISALKNLDIDYGSLALNSINNTFFQYESTINSFPLNVLSDNGFNTINMKLFIQTITNEIIPISLPAGGGYCNVKISLVKKQKK